MPRLSVLCGMSRRIIRFSNVHRNLWRLLSDSSDSTINPPVSELSENNVKKFKKETQGDHTGHLFVWPEAKEENVHHVEEIKEDSNDDITASWGWKNDELDVEQLAGLPGPSEVEDPYRQAINEYEDDQLHFAEDDHQSGIQEELQFARTRFLREQLTQNQDSQEPFTTFEKTSLTSVRENVDFMMQELSQISLILNTLGEAENTMGMVNSEPEMASFTLNQPNISESLDNEEISNPSLDSELNSATPDQSGLAVADDEVISNQSTEVLSELSCALSEPSRLGCEENWDHSANANPSLDSELPSDISHQPMSDHKTEAIQSLDTELFDETCDQSGLVVTESLISNEDIGEELTTESHEIERIVSASDTQESSPSKTNQNAPQTDDKQDIQPKETIHTYRPFRTIEIPAQKPTSMPRSLCTESIEEQPLIEEPQSATGVHLDSEGYKVSAQLTECESRLLMRMALTQALEDLESGQNKYKATILEAETE
ncbi:protein P200 [Drosophila teissieri]|uniref:protein P200 n=1 Tax=Drosophila teissieri TaxID=7243 RepID=UPI001CBA2413|nr:protein P200 [Drosophila teissieri]